MPLNPPVCSPPIGSASTSCLRRFIVHFRRPKNLKNGYAYRGEYGFDWLRDEYIYPIETVSINNTWPANSITLRVIPALVNAPQALCKDPVYLRAEYQKDVKNTIAPHGQDYYPAWLSIFSTGTPNGSTMHKSGVKLTLQLDEIDEIVDDRTEIILRSGKSCLKVIPDKIPISEFIASGKKSRSLGVGRTINYYELVSKVNIKCEGDTLTDHEEIKVIAKLANTEVEVGKLMVYKNHEIPIAKIVTIDVITKYDSSGKPIRAKEHKSYEYLYKYQSFNQALVRAEIHKDTKFDLVNLATDPMNSDVRDFLLFCEDPTRMAQSNAGDHIRNTLQTLYEKYGKFTPPSSLGINNDGHNWSYLLFTTLEPSLGNLFGIASLDYSTLTWGNIYVIFNTAKKDDHTIVHEGGHCFSLYHSFQDTLVEHVYHHGYTENYMDYTQKAESLDAATGYITSYIDNNYKGAMYSFFKWQWDIIRRDRSVEY